MNSTGRVGSLVLGAWVFVLGPAAMAQSPGHLFSNEAYLAPNAIDAVATFDFDGNGLPDVATISYPATLTIHRNDGGGLLASVGSFNLADWSITVAAGDTTGDGVPEVLSATRAGLPPRLETFTPNGQGGFSPFLSYPLPIGAAALALGDLDNNGSLDVVVAGIAMNTDAVFLNIGTGGFTFTSSFSAVGPLKRIVRLADANHDGKLDLFQCGSQGSPDLGAARVYYGNGDGTFAAGPSAQLQNQYLCGAFADVTGDGEVDLVSANYSSSASITSFVCHKNDGTGALTAVSGGSTPVFPKSIHLGDLTGDGVPDMILAHDSAFDRTFEVYAGAGNGSFSLLGVRSLGSSIVNAKILDMDGDGFGDVVGGGGDKGQGFGVFLGDGQGGFQSAGIPTTGLVTGVAAADLDQDGIPDLVNVESSTSLPNVFGAIRVRLGLGHLAFAPPVTIPADSSVAKVAIADFDRDGNPDLLATNIYTGTATFALGHGDGSFAPTSEVQLGLAAPGSIWARIGDFDGNGFPDALINNHYAKTVTVLLGSPGGFGAPAQIPTGDAPDGLAVADLDLDGKLDAVVTFAANPVGALKVLYGDGAGGFSPLELPAPSGFYLIPTIAIQDVNEDGIPDFALGSPNAVAVVLLAHGFGSWVPHAAVTVPYDCKDTLLTDVDRDGHADLVECHSNASVVSITFGDGTGSFTNQRQFYGSGFCYDLEACDFDSDGRVDMAVANNFGRSVSFLHGVAPAVPGVSTYGAGTIGCQGKHGISVKSTPTVGNPNFGITSTNAPPNALGLGAYASYPDVAGTDLFQIGLTIHLDFLTSPTTGTFDLHSDAGGNGLGPLPIPNFPWLVGATYYFQTYWVFGPSEGCHPSSLGFSSSPGMAMTIAP